MGRPEDARQYVSKSEQVGIYPQHEWIPGTGRILLSPPAAFVHIAWYWL